MPKSKGALNSKIGKQIGIFLSRLRGVYLKMCEFKPKS